jgi:hypothetical protein
MTLHGGPFMVRAYAIAASEEWDPYDVVALNGDGALLEQTAANKDVVGSGLGSVTSGTSDATGLRAYISAETTGKHEPVAVFNRWTLFETDDYNSTGQAAVADIGERADLELVTADWGINNGTSATGSTPNFAIIDIERTRGTFLVLPDPILVAATFQLFDGSV